MTGNKFTEGCKTFFKGIGESCKKFKENLYYPNNKGKLNWAGILMGIAGVFISVFILKFIVQHAAEWGLDWRNLKGVTLYTPSKTPFNEFDFENTMIRQPWNTFSSLAYVFFGIYLMYLPWKKKDPNIKAMRAQSSLPLRLVYCFSMIVTGLGSTFMHMSMTFAGQICDVVGMYLIALYLILYAFRNIKGMKEIWFYIPYIIGNAILLVTLFLVPDTRRYLFAIFIVAGLLCEVLVNRGKMNFKYIVIGCVVMLAGYTCWQLDQMSEFYVNELAAFREELGYLPGLFFSKTGILQGHTIWHVCGAVAAFYLFKHYLTEDDSPVTPSITKETADEKIQEAPVSDEEAAIEAVEAVAVEETQAE